jgi:hypothetical protein
MCVLFVFVFGAQERTVPLWQYGGTMAVQLVFLLVVILPLLHNTTVLTLDIVGATVLMKKLLETKLETDALPRVQEQTVDALQEV